MSFPLITFSLLAAVWKEICCFRMFHTYSEEPAWNIFAGEVFWVVTVISLNSLLPVTPPGGLCFYLSLQWHLHVALCVNCLSQALANFLSVLFIQHWTSTALGWLTGTRLPARGEHQRMKIRQACTPETIQIPDPERCCWCGNRGRPVSTQRIWGKRRKCLEEN